MTKDEICGLLRQIHDVLAMQSETNQVKSASDYERGFIDGMQKQAESSVDRAVNAMSRRTWVGLTDEEVDEIYTSVQLEVNDHWDNGGTTMMFPLTLYKAIEAKLKEKNT
jgi:hypothetical protein